MLLRPFADDDAQAFRIDAVGDADERRHAGNRAALIGAVAGRAVAGVRLLARATWLMLARRVAAAAAAATAASAGVGSSTSLTRSSAT